MCVVPANAGTLVKGSGGAAIGSGILIVERNMPVDIVANSLYAGVTRRNGSEELPCGIGQEVRFAVAASEQKDEYVFGQILDGILSCAEDHLIWQAGVSDDAIRGQSKTASRSENAIATIPKPIAIDAYGNHGFGGHVIGYHDIAGAGVMDIDLKDDRSGLRKTIDEFEAGAKLQGTT